MMYIHSYKVEVLPPYAIVKKVHCTYIHNILVEVLFSSVYKCTCKCTHMDMVEVLVQNIHTCTHTKHMSTHTCSTGITVKCMMAELWHVVYHLLLWKLLVAIEPVLPAPRSGQVIYQLKLPGM